MVMRPETESWLSRFSPADRARIVEAGLALAALLSRPSVRIPTDREARAMRRSGRIHRKLEKEYQNK